MAIELQRAHVYDLKLNFVTVGGVRIGGWGEDAAVTYEFASDVMEPTVGGDGLVTFSAQNNDMLTATLTVMETSASYKYLWGQLVLQQQGFKTGVVPPLPYGHLDAANGDLVASRTAVFLARPVPSKGRNVGTREFRLALPYGGSVNVLGLGRKIL